MLPMGSPVPADPIPSLILESPLCGKFQKLRCNEAASKLYAQVISSLQSHPQQHIASIQSPNIHFIFAVAAPTNSQYLITA
jgi:hypothetical protein